MIAEAVLQLILLHTVEGREIAVNPVQITSMHGAVGQNKLMAQQVRCVVMLTDGKFVSVRETCDEVKQLLGRTP